MKNNYLNKCYENLKINCSHEKEFLQAVEEFLDSIEDIVENNSIYEENSIVERMLIPERLIQFKVTWIDRYEKYNVNNGYRVQFNSAIGPYKGGLRFHPSVNTSLIKFLGFEQIFKNSLTGLPMGGGKGGSDFDPKGKTDAEIMNFCQNFMMELQRHIGQFTDVPAGDIGVGEREIGYLFAYYKKIKNEFTGTLTGKSLSYGGSFVRKQATGYGLIYIVDEMLKSILNESFEDKIVSISGSGNVAIYACEKAVSLGARVVTMSDSSGFIYDEDGIDIELIKDIKENKRLRINEYIKYKPNAKFFDNCKDIWSIKCDIALPCATQNELDEEDSYKLIKNGCIAVGEGANMPCTSKAVDLFIQNKICFMPAKAANAGGVSVSGLEMTQNSMRMSWSFEEVDEKLHDIMKNIFLNVSNTAKSYGYENNFVKGANIAGFLKVSEAMLYQGI